MISIEKFNFCNLEHYLKETEIDIDECQRENIGRIIKTSRLNFTVQLCDKALRCTLSTLLLKSSMHAYIGDWVVIKDDIIQEILPRYSTVSRKIADRRISKQILAANIDSALILISSDNISEKLMLNFISICTNLKTTVVFTKSDILNVDLDYFKKKYKSLQFISVNIVESNGLDTLTPKLKIGETILLLGQSGVGKSSVVNKIFQKSVMKTGDINEKNKLGRHTTTHSQLITNQLYSIIDIPGVRFVTSWEDSSSNQIFGELLELSKSCKFRNCTHNEEIGCNVRGKVDIDIIDQFRKEKRIQQYYDRNSNFKTKNAHSQKIKQELKRKNKY